MASSVPHVDTGSAGHRQGDWTSVLGNIGLTARGVLYVVLGILAGQFAFGTGGSEQVSNQGAIRFVREAPFGTVLLWVLALGLAALALWQLVDAVLGDPIRASDAVHRALLGVKGLIHGAIATTVVLAALGGGTSSGGGSEQEQATAVLFELPLGRWIVGAIGLGVVAYAVRTTVKHVRDAGFMERLATSRMEPASVRAIRTAGRVGYGARATVFGLIGGFLVVAAVQHSSDQSRGLAGSVLALSQQAYGTWLLAGVAVGLVMFGIFSLVEARHRRSA